MNRQIEKKILWLIGTGAFIVYQLVNFLYFPLATTFGDEIRFINEAKTISEIGEFWNFNDRAWEMPLVAILYGLFYSFIGNEAGLIIAVRVFQSLLLIGQAVLMYNIALKVFKDNIGALVTFIVILFYPFFVYYQGLLLSETIFNTTIVAGFYFIYVWYEERFKINKTFLLANFFLVLSLYIKGTLSILPPLLFMLFYLINKRDLKESIKVFIYSSILYALLLSPWWIRNYMIFNQFVPFTTSSGKVLYLGNNAENKFGGCDMGSDVNLKKFADIGSIDDELLRNKTYKQEAIQFIKQNPDRFLILMYYKLKRFYSITPNAEAFNQGYYKWLSILSYGSVFVLFIVSIIAHLKYFRKLSAIYILFAYFTVLHMILIASLRYRLPLEPFMILLSSNVVSLLYRRIYER